METVNINNATKKFLLSYGLRLKGIKLRRCFEERGWTVKTSSCELLKRELT